MEKVSDIHSHLYHYTNWVGLKGILDSQSIWATHIKYLNDQSEYLLAREPIHRLLLPRIEHMLKGRIAASKAAEKWVEDNGGIHACQRKIALGLTNAIFEATGDEFYVASFCGKSSSAYVEENGLLSQWRGYGSGGGFAIVFNSKKLEMLLEHESKLFDYGPSPIADAIYSDDSAKFELEFVPVFEDFMKYADVMLPHAIFEEPAPTTEESAAALRAIHMCTTRFKHLGFKEENEVRIVAAPTKQTPEYMQHCIKAGKIPSSPKKVEFRTASNKPVPFIELFGFEDRRLPIEKIIVGLGENKKSVSAAIKRMVFNRDIDVAVSDIPYV